MKQQQLHMHTSPYNQNKGSYQALSTNNLQFRPSSILMNNSPFATPIRYNSNLHLQQPNSGRQQFQYLSKVSPFQNPHQKIYSSPAIDSFLRLDLNSIQVKQAPIQRGLIIYSDDDKITPRTLVPNSYNLEENLEFSITSQYDCVKFKNARQTLPAMITLKAKELQQAKETIRSGVDLICIIDRSGSMEGDKMATVKKTLKLLLKFLSEQDRLCLIEFDEEARRLTPLKRVTKQNIHYFYKVIDQLQAGGGTVISAGTQIAFEQIKKRKYRNDVTSIFLLSDGQDESAEVAVQTQLKQFDDPFTIHSFGFGVDHDAEMMTSICSLKNGSFYFVNDISLLDEFFVDALGGLVSVVGDNIEIMVKLTAQSPFDCIKIQKSYGTFWQKVNDQNYRITLPQLASGNRKDFVFELALPKFQAEIGDDQRVATIVKAQLKIHSTHKDQTIQKQASLKLNFFNSNEQIPQSIENIDVSSQYYRVKGADVIDDARRACEQQQFLYAQNMIDQALMQITKNKKVVAISEGIIQDLLQVRQASMQSNFASYGGSQMYQISTNYRNQGGINSMFDQRGTQIQAVKPQIFQNSVQTMWVNEVQRSKRTNQF